MAGPVFPKLTDQGNKTTSVCSCYTTWAWTRSELDRVGQSHWRFLTNRGMEQDFRERRELPWARHGSRRGGAAVSPREGTCTVARTRVHDPPLSDLANSASCTRALVFVPLTVAAVQCPFFCALPRMSLCVTSISCYSTHFHCTSTVIEHQTLFFLKKRQAHIIFSTKFSLIVYSEPQ